MGFHPDDPRYYRGDLETLPNVSALQTHGCDIAGRVRDHEDCKARVRDQSDFVNNAPNRDVSLRRNSEDGNDSDPDYGSSSYYDRIEQQHLSQHPNLHYGHLPSLGRQRRKLGLSPSFQ